MLDINLERIESEIISFETFVLKLEHDHSKEVEVRLEFATCIIFCFQREKKVNTSNNFSVRLKMAVYVLRKVLK